MINAGIGDAREINMRGNVLQTYINQRVYVGVMLIVAHERALIALWMIMFTRCKSIINHQNNTVLQHISKAGNQATGCRTDFSEIAIGQIELVNRIQQMLFSQRHILKSKTYTIKHHAALA